MAYAFRLLATAIVAALTASLVGGLLMVTYDYLTGPTAFGIQSLGAGWAFTSAMTFPFTLAGLILIGLPVDWFLTRRRWANLPTYVIAGAASGLLIGLVLLDPLASAGAMFGALAAAAWWAASRSILRDFRPVAVKS